MPLVLSGCITIANPLQIEPLVNISAAEKRLAFTPDGALLAAGCNDGYVRVWNAADGSGKQRRRFFKQ